MTPVFAMMNHHGLWNSKWGKANSTGTGGLSVKASRPIAADEQLFISYGKAAPELFRDYGFVEPMPQRWWFESNNRTYYFKMQADGVRFPDYVTPEDHRFFASAANSWLQAGAASQRSVPIQCWAASCLHLVCSGLL